MPLNIRWKQKDYLSIALMFLGACGIFQALIIFIAQYFLRIGNYLILIIVPIGVILGLFYCSIIIFDSYAQVERRKKIRTQFQKISQLKKFKKFLQYPVVRPLLIVFSIFSVFFFTAYFLSYLYLSNIFSFLIAENAAMLVCILITNLIEKHYGKVRRY
jgi:H+/gluconate symporter-like permease